MVGRRLGHYEIDEHLGSGGMGDVYRANDSRLGRNVALKFLRPDLAGDPARVARFRAEAKTLAALNHPHIAAIHGQEEADGLTFLVLEFVPGQTLDERIDRQPLDVPEAIAIAVQIVGALEAAHERGIVHRDLKPANVKITPDGQVKVLDFGLAKVAAPADDGWNTNGANTDATVTLPPTRIGVIIGTPAYMSPEQARGLPVDRRSDIFSFGCLLFEMLTGRRAFAGPSGAEALSQVLQREPDWTLLPPSVPPAVERVLRLCLEKDPRHRRQSAGDVRVDLERAKTEPAAAASPSVGRWRTAHVAALAGGLIAMMALAVWASRSEPTPPQEMRTMNPTPHTLDPMHFALSPDAARLVFRAPADDGVERLFVRELKRQAPQMLAGTDGARFPFWSPDSRSIGYFADRKLYRLDIAGGPPQALAPAANPLGGTWGTDGTILFAPTTVSPLYRVPATPGGKLVPATELRAHHTNHRGPSFLPDGRRFLFYVVSPRAKGSSEPDESGIYLGSLDGTAPKRLTAAVSAAVYFPPERVMFVEQDGRLVVRQIDVARGELSGEPITVADDVSVTANVGWFSVSAAGLVAYRSGTSAPRRSTWFDRNGQVLGVLGDLNAPAISGNPPRFIAYDRTVDGNRDVWVKDLDRESDQPLTRHPLVDGHPVWSPDGSQIAFHSQRNKTFDVWKMPSAGGMEEVVFAGPAHDWPLDWSSDGRFLLVEQTNDNYASSDLIAVPMTGATRTPIVVAAGEFEERMGNFSPNVRWVAYETDKTGRPEVVIAPFQRAGVVVTVSAGGGSAPRWSADGRELYFIAPDGKMMAASISEYGSTLAVGKPAELFQTHITGQMFTYQWAKPRDGRFLVNHRQVDQASAPPIWIVQNWKP